MKMNINVYNVYKITFVIIGTIIGAGFASGQEIYSFFNKYGNRGLIGIFLSIGIITYIIYKTFNIIMDNNINNYETFIIEIMPEKLKDNKILIFTINNIINIFLLISFNVMVAGFATYFFQELNIPKIYGALLIAILSFIILINNIEGIIKINTYLMPIIILLICFLGINKIQFIHIVSEWNIKSHLHWLLSGILYASYNSIALIPIIISLKTKIKTKKEITLITFFVGIVMTILSLNIFLLINTFINKICEVEIPIAYIASFLGKSFKKLYGIVILIAIFTTAVSSGYSFLKNTTKSKNKYLILALIISIFSIFVGQFSFSNLINILYPIFGYLGIIQIIFLVIK